VTSFCNREHPVWGRVWSGPGSGIGVGSSVGSGRVAPLFEYPQNFPIKFRIMSRIGVDNFDDNVIIVEYWKEMRFVSNNEIITKTFEMFERVPNSSTEDTMIRGSLLSFTI